MKDFPIRTDLALEAKESIKNADGEIHGVRVEKTEIPEKEITVTKVSIDTKNGAKIIGKPIGVYVTIEADLLPEIDEEYHREISIELANQLREMLPQLKKECSVIIVGLGNKDVTADSLGPSVVEQIYMTRHLINLYGKASLGKEKVHSISGIVPGVMAKTGMETAEIMKGIISETKPEIMVVIDSLAARSAKRLNRTIQISDAGIHPGSGVGNHRNALTKESMGIPVIAIGVPTVVDAVVIAKDASAQVQSELTNFYLTGKDIDEIIHRVSYTISEALNILFDSLGNTKE